MNEHGPSHKHHEQAPPVTRSPSFTEQLLSPSVSPSDVPYNIRTDASFINQVTSRRNLIDVYTEYARDTNNQEARRALYTKLAHTFDTDTMFTRAALYIPFTVLPDASDTHVEATALISSYKQAFMRLLDEVDIRAGFVDGDVLEPALRHGAKPEQITKAPHLLPWLMRKGIFSQEEVLSLVRHATTPTSIQAFADVIPVLYHESLLDERIHEVLATSTSKVFTRLASRLKHTQETTPALATVEQTPKDIFASFTQTYEATKRRIASSSVSEARKIWQTEIQTERLQSDFAHRLLHYMGDIDKNVIDALLEKNDPLTVSLLMTACRLQAGKEFETSHSIEQHTQTMISYVLSKTAHVKDSVTKRSRETLQAYVHHYGLDASSYEAPQFIANKETSLTKQYMESLAMCATHIEHDPLLSRFVYPVTLSLGSYAKGYAKKESDMDMGIFIKPETQESNRESIERALEAMLSQLHINGSCMEFWLEDNNGTLSIKNYESPDQHRGDSSLTHPLTGEWVGNLDATKTLRQQLLRMYLESSNKTIDNEDARHLWVTGMEHNLLQYRLMHKGYASHIPPHTTKRHAHHFSIDGDSMFYDEGYRTVAFDMYLKKIFLPVYTKDN